MALFNKLKNLADKATSIANGEMPDLGDIASFALDKAKNRKPKVKERDNMGVLSTPPAPPVPNHEPQMSVSIAVNGQSYGPYERATLLDMISKGSLTPATLVFINGMSQWLPANKVPEVNALFQLNAPAPPVPPVPWTGPAGATPAVPAAGNEDNNVLSPRLNRLIDAAVADGEISDMERDVLIRNAQEEGVAMDEFVMILEARLYEQRQTLIAREKELQHKQELERINAQAKVPPTPAAAPAAHNQPKKCPHCGAPIKLLAACCPECGCDYEVTGEAQTSNSAERLAKLLRELDEKQSHTSGFSDAMSGQNIYTKRATIIESFPIPNNKLDIFDLFTSCVTKSKSGLFATPDQKAYYKKSKEILIKARVVLDGDQKLLNQINELAAKYKIKV